MALSEVLNGTAIRQAAVRQFCTSAELQQRLAACADDGACGSEHNFLLVSLDHYPAIRQQVGEAIWHQAMALMARIIASGLKPGDLAAPHGEHEFILWVHAEEVHPVDHLVRHIHEAVEHANEAAALPLTISATIGTTRALRSLQATVERAQAAQMTTSLLAPESVCQPPPPHANTVAPPLSLMPAPDTRRESIVLVEDEHALLYLMRETLSATGADIACVRHAADVVDLVKRTAVDVVVADIHLPDMNGIDLLKDIRLADPGVVVIMITGSRDVGLAIHAIRFGADDYLVKPFTPQQLRESVSRALTKRQLILGGKAYQAMLESQVQQRTREFAQVIRHLEATYRTTLQALGAALDTRDVETHAHSERVARYALKLGRLLCVPEPDLVTLERGVYLHDIGKIGIPDRVLLKQGRLSEEEWDIMRRHSQLGFRLASRIDFLKDASKIILTHHERYDGQGYPYGLRGDAIPFGARIFAVVDTLDAMTSDRPYRKAQRFANACEEILRHSGRQFDPRVVEAFLSVPEHTWSDIREDVNQSARRVLDHSDERILAEGRIALLS